MRVGARPAARGRRGGNGLPDAGGLLLHPASLLALAVLLLNDHVLKSAWPGPLTGKLSDFAGLVFFPVFMVSAWEIMWALAHRWRGPTITVLVIAAIASTTTFALVKTFPSAAEVAGRAFGFAQWLVALPVPLAAGQPVPSIVTTRVIADPTDLVALPAVAVAVWIGAARVRNARSSDPIAEELSPA